MWNALPSTGFSEDTAWWIIRMCCYVQHCTVSSICHFRKISRPILDWGRPWICRKNSHQSWCSQTDPQIVCLVAVNYFPILLNVHYTLRYQSSTPATLLICNQYSLWRGIKRFLSEYRATLYYFNKLIQWTDLQYLKVEAICNVLLCLVAKLLQQPNAAFQC